MHLLHESLQRNDKAKPVERQGRKTTDLKETAGLPMGGDSAFFFVNLENQNRMAGCRNALTMKKGGNDYDVSKNDCNHDVPVVCIRGFLSRHGCG